MLFAELQVCPVMSEKEIRLARQVNCTGFAEISLRYISAIMRCEVKRDACGGCIAHRSQPHPQDCAQKDSSQTTHKGSRSAYL